MEDTYSLITLDNTYGPFDSIERLWEEYNQFIVGSVTAIMVHSYNGTVYYYDNDRQIEEFLYLNNYGKKTWY